MVRARKRFGQHFLEPGWVEKVTRAVHPAADETFLEIGPGRGALTRSLAPLARHVLACEIDRDLAALLRAEDLDNVTIIECDFLTLGVEDIRAALSRVDGGETLRVVGNLPYNVASPILVRLLELLAAGLPMVDATIMLQQEVAARLIAAPGTRDYGVLTVLVAMAADVRLLLTLPPGAFRPVPKVVSSMVRLRFRPPPNPPADPRLFTAFVRAIFTQRRKTLQNALRAFTPAKRFAAASVLSRAGVDGRRRPETLSQEELVRLADVLAAFCADESLAR